MIRSPGKKRKRYNTEANIEVYARLEVDTENEKHQERESIIRRQSSKVHTVLSLISAHPLMSAPFFKKVCSSFMLSSLSR